MKWLKKILWLILVISGLFCLFLLIIVLTDFRPEPVEKLVAKGNAREISETDSIYSVTTWNIGYFGLGKECDFFYDGGKMTRPAKTDYYRYAAETLKYLDRSAKSDFYFFQEVDLNSARSYRNYQVKKISGLFQGYESAIAINYDVQFVPIPLRKPMGKVKSGLFSMTRYISTENSRYALPGGYSWPVRLFQLDRCFLLTRVPLPSGKDLVLINTHNEAYDDGSQRIQQLAILKNVMLKEYDNGNFVIAGGDWNQNPVGYKMLRFTNEDLGRYIEPPIDPNLLPEGWQWAFDPEIPTNRDVNQPYIIGETRTTIIDFFVVSPNISVIEIKTDDLGFEWSDHQPVRMRFRLGHQPKGLKCCM